MPQLGPSPFVWLQFDELGALKAPDAIANLDAALAKTGITDLVVLTHGWQTDLPGAQTLYSRLWCNAASSLKALGSDPANVVVAGVLWPSKPYNANYDGGAALVGTALAGGGALSIEDPARPGRLSATGFEAVLDETKALFGPRADLLIKAARAAAADPSKALELFEAARAVIGLDVNAGDPELGKEASFFAGTQSRTGALNLLSAYSMPFQLPVDPNTGAAQGLGNFITGVLQGAENGVAWILNKLSYYSMKERAGVSGQALGADVLPTLHPPAGLRLHLIGHSFGARLVTAAVDALPDGPLKVQSLTLLQGAYSQNGMTRGKGPFSGVPGKVMGPLAMTRTHNDLACTIAYPLASRLSNDTAKALGDANDPFGAMGANGAQLTASFLAPDCNDDDFHPIGGKVNRFLADGYIVKTAESDAHNNIYNPTCGKLVAAIITTP